MPFNQDANVSADREIQSRNETVLCFLHPVGTSGRIWDSVVSELGGLYRVLTLDLPGHGETPLTKRPFRLEDAAEWVSTQLAHLNGNVVLIGHSIGGMIAQIAASTNPTWLKGLVLVSTMSCPPSEVAREAIADRATMTREVGMEGMLKPTLERWFTRRSLDERPDIIELTSRLLLANDPEIHAEAWEAIAGLNTVDLLPKIQSPTLVVVGDEDVSTPPALSEAIVKQCTRARMEVIYGAGHALPLETTAEFVEVLRRFVGSLEDVPGEGTTVDSEAGDTEDEDSTPKSITQDEKGTVR